MGEARNRAYGGRACVTFAAGLALSDSWDTRVSRVEIVDIEGPTRISSREF